MLSNAISTSGAPDGTRARAVLTSSATSAATRERSSSTICPAVPRDGVSTGRANAALATSSSNTRRSSNRRSRGREATRPTINSPMVGTFYRSSGPEEKVFCNVGDLVDENSTVCIIEAMKVMNEIKAEKSGTITACVAEDCTPVQYGDVLFRIK